MRLLWSPRSPFARKVMVCAHETGQAAGIERVPAVVTPFAADLGVARYNPLVRIPTLILADGTVLHDSLVICEYLDGLQDAPTLIPRSGADRLAVLTLHAFGQGLAELLVQWVMLRTRIAGRLLDDFARTSAFKLAGTLDLLESRVSSWTSPRPDVGMIAVGSALGYLDFRFPAQDWRPGRPQLAAWYQAFSARPSMAATAPRD